MFILMAVASYVIYLCCTGLKAKDDRIDELKSTGILCDSKPMKPHERKACWINKGGEAKNLECQ